MPAFMKEIHAQAYALMRIVAGFLFLSHGASKLFEFPMSPPPEIPPIITYVAGLTSRATAANEMPPDGR